MELSMQNPEGLKEKVEEIRCQLDAWRKTRISRQNVPEPFWKAAVEFARIEGIAPVAAVLGLNYYRLKRRVEAGQNAITESKAVSFVELQVNPVAHPLECTAELTNRRGATMRLRLVGAGAAELVALVQAFWQEPR
jgi:hypothetical protein